MNTERKQITYNKIVNFDKENGEITVLNYVFDDTLNGGTSKGATGTKFEPISKERYDEETEEENIIERIIDCGLSNDNARYGAQGVYDSMDSEQIREFAFNTSYSEMWDELREELNLNEDEAYIFNCIGGGRCFDKDFQGNVNTELSAIIREYEA